MAVLKFRDYSKILFVVIFLFFLYGLYKVISPFIADILAAIVLSIVAYPIYKNILKGMKRKTPSAIITVLLVLLIITIPGIFFANALLHEAITIYNSVGSIDLHTPSERLKELTGLNIEFDRYVREMVRDFSNLFINSSSDMISFLATGFIHIFTTFFIMFFFLKDGKELIEIIKKGIPISPYQKIRLFKGTGDLVNGIFLGFLSLGVIEFLASLLGFYLFGIPNPILWSLVIAIFAYIPVLGPAAVWVPASVYLFINGETQSAIFLAIYFWVIISFYMDNILRAQLIKKTAKVHPVLSVLGIFGGLKVFGIIGLIIGPLILSLFVLMYKLYLEEDDNT